MAVWNLKTFRPILFWKAHEGGLLSIEPWAAGILTCVNSLLLLRDTKLLNRQTRTRQQDPLLPPPFDHSLHLSHCRHSSPKPQGSNASRTVLESRCQRSGVLQDVASPPAERREWRTASSRCGARAHKGRSGSLLAGLRPFGVSLLTDEQVDIFHLPSLARVHRSVGADAFAINDKTGSFSPSPSLPLTSLRHGHGCLSLSLPFTCFLSTGFPPKARHSPPPRGV